MILDKIAKDTRERVERQKSTVSLDRMKEMAMAASSKSYSFKQALGRRDGLSIIAEVKKASPSKGIIAADFDPVSIARSYESARVDAVSVLTEPFHFLGDNAYLTSIKQAVSLPVLRKDFIIDPYQIYEAKAIGADAVLLIAALLPLETLEGCYQLAKNLGLDILVETHTQDEVRQAVTIGADIIGINNRNLHTFEVDLQTTIGLRKLIPDGKILVSESGIRTPHDIHLLKENNIDAVLIGETFMRAADKEGIIKSFRENKHESQDLRH